MDMGDLKGLDAEDLEGVAGGKMTYYEAVREVYWDIYQMRYEGRTREEAYAHCEERFAENQPQIEATIQTYLKHIYDDVDWPF